MGVARFQIKLKSFVIRFASVLIHASSLRFRVIAISHKTSICINKKFALVYANMSLLYSHLASISIVTKHTNFTLFYYSIFWVILGKWGSAMYMWLLSSPGLLQDGCQQPQGKMRSISWNFQFPVPREAIIFTIWPFSLLHFIASKFWCWNRIFTCDFDLLKKLH
jgi:hypothetical protein